MRAMIPSSRQITRFISLSDFAILMAIGFEGGIADTEDGAQALVGRVGGVLPPIALRPEGRGFRP